MEARAGKQVFITLPGYISWKIFNAHSIHPYTHTHARTHARTHTHTHTHTHTYTHTYQRARCHYLLLKRFSAVTIHDTDAILVN